MQCPSAPWLLASLLLAGSCGRALAPGPLPGEGCDDEGDVCSCDDGERGRYVCEDDVLQCACEDSVLVGRDAAHDTASTRDAGSRRDAGTDAGRRDAGAREAGARDAGGGAGDARTGDAGSSSDAAAADASRVTDAAVEGEGDGGTDPTGGSAPRIPPKPAECPEIKTGTITVLDQRVQLWVGEKQTGKHGPILFYWHGTGSSSAEALGGLGVGHAEILAEGGVVASFSTTTKTGMNTGNNVWYTGDFAMADQILACAIAQQDVDPRRVYTAGCSAGGLQASAMVYGRSSYLAAAMPNSGGTVFPYQLEDPAHVPAFIGTHGAEGRDVVIIDFAQTTARQVKDLAAKGGLAVQCDHGGGHCASPQAVKNAQWKFLKDHPFGVAPEPYLSGLPADFPSVCKIIAK